MPGRDQDEHYRITWLVRRLFRAMSQKSNESLEDLGVSAADRAVMEFLYPDQALSVPEIAQRYQVSRQHVQVTVNSLLDKGLAVTAENPRHCRSHLVLLSDRGKDLFARIRAQDGQIIKALFTGVSAGDVKVTRETLEALLAQLAAGDQA